mmetsp:Transcript_83726/g.240650  ORF Transcript_83726/g.240650 Transcript_83726/m.240650 type:complete len:375 (+) Transcript_83726:77-1201(+)
MPHQKGRKGDTVPHREHRTSKRADAACIARPSSGIDMPKRLLSLEMGEAPSFEDRLPLPLELWMRVLGCSGPAELCRCDTLGRSVSIAMRRQEGELWECLCDLTFPSMMCSVRSSSSSPAVRPASQPASPSVSAASPGRSPASGAFAPQCARLEEEDRLELPPSAIDDAAAASSPAEPVASDWKLLYARRWQKQRKWDQARSSRVCGDGLGAVAGSSKHCANCGELIGPSSGECAWHPGNFAPRSSVPGRTLAHLGDDTYDVHGQRRALDATAGSDWSRAELQQLQAFARAAWRSVGGTSGVQKWARNYRGGGHWAKGLGFKGWGSDGHWAKGLGARPGPGRLRECIDGHVPCAWSCCGSEDLISDGCALGRHR